MPVKACSNPRTWLRRKPSRSVRGRRSGVVTALPDKFESIQLFLRHGDQTGHVGSDSSWSIRLKIGVLAPNVGFDQYVGSRDCRIPPAHIISAGGRGKRESISTACASNQSARQIPLPIGQGSEASGIQARRRLKSDLHADLAQFLEDWN